MSVGEQVLPGTEILMWLASRRAACGLVCRPIDWAEIDDSWRLCDGRLVHSTGRYFSIRGIRAESNRSELHGIEQPLIDQPEVGILGLLFHQSGSDVELLMQAKTEPGNVDACQLAPTVQATVSNYERIHGGAPTPYLDPFLEQSSSRTISDTCQSEHGTRFLGKYNRNASQLVDTRVASVSESWAWVRLRELLPLLRKNFVLNTDVRSTLVCTDWMFLCGGREPFQEESGEPEVRSLLRESWESATDISTPTSLLRSWREQVSLSVTSESLSGLTGWTIETDGTIRSEAGEFEVRLFDIHAADREVSEWKQPLVADLAEERIVLICQRQEGVPRFLLAGSVEVGFRECVQFGPSFRLKEPGITNLLRTDRFTEWASVRHSEEGGRFFRSTAQIQIIEVSPGEPIPLPEFHVWVTARQIHEMLGMKGLINNELRTAVSVLLSWL